jgi:hypothetical protein
MGSIKNILQSRTAKYLYDKIEVINNRITLSVLIAIAIIVIYLKLFGVGITSEYTIVSWNDIKVNQSNKVLITNDKFIMRLCGEVVSSYKLNGNLIIFSPESNDYIKCSDDNNLRLSLAYALEGKMSWRKSYNKLILTDDTRGNVFVLKRSI